MRRFLLHLLLLSAVSAAIAVIACRGQLVWLAVAGPLWVWSVVRIVRIYRNYSGRVALLLDSLENDDSTIHFPEKIKPHSDAQVNMMLNRITAIVHGAKIDAEQREKYYELILDFIDTGVVIIDDRGAVYQKNAEALRLLGLRVFTHINQLRPLSPRAAAFLAEAVPGDSVRITMNAGARCFDLAFRISALTLSDRNLRIVAMSDISRELDDNRIEAWSDMSRVLTHEIMNSLSPVTSIIDMLATLPGASDPQMSAGLATVAGTSRSLMRFVESYRRLTRLPDPEPTLFYVEPFLKRMVELARNYDGAGRVRFVIEACSDDLIVYADESQLGQVVINLLKNSVEALAGADSPEVVLKAFCDERERVNIAVSNNGPLIDDLEASRIFVPFFTTKNEGSGIGLSLSKQIMRLHNGTLTLVQRPVTTFVLTL